MSMTDITLVEQSRLGDRESFGQIVRKYQGIVSGVVYGILGDFHKSEDIAQETFLVAWKKLDDLREVEKLPGWLCGIARNLANHYRVKQPKVQTVSIDKASEITGKNDDPARILAQSEQNRLIWSALEKIPEKYRVPLVLFYRSGQSLTEIAEALELSKEVLSMRLSRARKYLRRELEKQVEGAIAANGPGEFFSLAVIAALPALATFSTTAKAVAGVAVGTETTFAASAMVAVPKQGPPIAAVFGVSLVGIYVSLLLGLVSTAFFCLFFLLAAIPGVWFSVRNAPTLRTRRYLILCSLRAHLLIAFSAFLVWAFFPTCQAIIALVEYGGIEISFKTKWTYIINPLSYGATGLLMVGTAFLILVSPWVYRRILREDTGLTGTGQQPTIERLEKTYKRLSTACLVMLIWYFAMILTTIALQMIGVMGINNVGLSGQREFQWDIGLLLEAYGLWFAFAIVGTVFYLVFRQFHRHLMDTAKDEATFHAVGPAWDRNKTPFAERVFVEWLVYFGCFVAAGLIVTSKPAFGYTDWIPYYPIPMSMKLALILVGSFLLAAINAGFPKLRWFVILGGCLLVGYGISGIYRSSLEYMGGGPGGTLWFDSPNDWPLLFGLILLNIYVVLAVFATFVFAGLHYYAKWTGKAMRFSLPKKAAVVYCVLGALLLCAAPWGYTSFQSSYWSNRIVFTKDDAKKLALCNEVMRLESDTRSRNYQSALLYRSKIYTDQQQYDLALADYNNIDYDSVLPRTGRGIYGRRGNVKFLLGDLHGAIEDYTKVEPLGVRSRDSNVLYHRGFAYEKLGETEKAIADYTAAIEMVEEYAPSWSNHFDAAVPREGYDNSRISLDELKEIRDRLLAEE